jgi:hypothetical protein
VNNLVFFVQLRRQNESNDDLTIVFRVLLSSLYLCKEEREMKNRHTKVDPVQMSMGALQSNSRFISTMSNVLTKIDDIRQDKQVTNLS